MKRYPLQPLIDALALPEAEVARLVGLSGTPLKRARERGFIESAADRYAVRAGFTPWAIWPDWLDDLEVECAERSCDKRFVPSRKGNVFCSHACNRRQQAREWANRKYATDPEFRARKLAQNRTYHDAAKRSQKVKRLAREAANPEAVKARRRRYYLQHREVELERARRYRERKSA